MDFRRAAILVVMDVLLLGELTFAIWWSHFEPAAITMRFTQVFLPAALLTILMTRLAFWRWAPKIQASAEEVACQPWRPVGLFGALDNAAPPPRHEQ